MSRALLALATALAVVAIGTTLFVAEAPRASAAPTTYEIDASHSTILFRLDHLGVSAAYGRFNTFSGSFVFDADNPAGCSVNVEVDASSVDTGHEGRDGHLKGPDFFNVAEHKTIAFKSTRVAKTTSAKHFDVTGPLTLHGVTKEVTIRMEKLGEKDLGERFGYRAGFEGSLVIKRTDFGMGWGVDKGSLGDEVKLTLAFEGVKK